MKIFKLLGRDAAKAGSVGLEIEVEGENLPFVNDEYWRTEHDGSLKTAEAFEYVLKEPVSFTKIRGVVDSLDEQLKGHGSVVLNSERAGVHVHINVQQDTIASLGSFICLYYLFETALLNFCGQKRAGNLFCLRLRDADAPIDYVLAMLRSKSFGILHTDKIRYGSLNLKALPQYGSLEFRGMRSTNDFNEIKTWIHLLLSLRKFARSLDKPSDIPELLKRLGPAAFTEQVFGNRASMLLCQEGFADSLHEDLFLISELVHTKAWEKEWAVPQQQRRQYMI